MTDKYEIHLDWTKELVEAESFRTPEMRHWLESAKSYYDTERKRSIIMLYSRNKGVIKSLYAMFWKECKNRYKVVFTFPANQPKYTLHVEFRGYE